MLAFFELKNCFRFILTLGLVYGARVYLYYDMVISG